MTSVYIFIKDIFLIIISISFFEILIPESKISKYIKFIFSMIILVIILEPVSLFLLNL